MRKKCWCEESKAEKCSLYPANEGRKQQKTNQIVYWGYLEVTCQVETHHSDSLINKAELK